MRHQGTALLAGWLGLAAALAVGQDAAEGLPRLVPTRETTFSIPINRTAVDSSQSAGIQLLMSVDRGRTWHVQASERPEASWFVVRTRGDGEYWFASRLLPKSGRPPAEVRQPELRVLVDTAAPKIDLTAVAEADGRIQITWRASDWWLAPSAPKIEYRAAGDVQWRQAPAEQPAESDAARREGTVDVRLLAPARVVEVRATAADAAGNEGETMRRVIVPFVTSPAAPRPRQPDPRADDPPVDPFSQIEMPHEGAKPWPGDAAEGDTPPGGAETSADTSGGVSEPDGFQDVAQLPPAERAGGLPARPVADRTEPPVEESRGSRPPAATANERAGEIARWINRREFPLAYEVDSVGPSGVASVELWITSDRGRTWRKFAEDADRTSPIGVAVAADGLYGFRVVVHNRDGLASEAPAGGDEADLWVGVDASAPVVRLTAAPYGRGADAGSLVIQWQADDDRLAESGVTLQYSREATGPWTTIAAGIPDSGEYAWRVEPHVPPRVFLRIEVADAAGNVAEDVLEEAVNLSGLRPKGRVRGILPE